MSRNELLDLEDVGILLLHLVGHLRNDFADGVDHVLAHVLVPEGLEHVTRQWLSFKLGRVDEVAVVASRAPLRSMEVLARNGSEIADLDFLVVKLFESLLLFEPLCFLRTAVFLKLRDLGLELRDGLGVLKAQHDERARLDAGDVVSAAVDERLQFSLELHTETYRVQF